MTDNNHLLIEQLRGRKAKIECRVAAACAEVGRDPADITIVAVTKTVDMETAAAAFAAGFHDLGENRPQELLRKQAGLQALSPTWHMIGSLQRNKVRSILHHVSLIHAVDSIRLAKTISRIAAEESLEVEALLQVNVSGEASKHGFAEEQLVDALAVLTALPHITWRGLMTMAPVDTDEDFCRHLFETTRKRRNICRSNATMPTFDLLSMGMSNDFEAAVKAGATHIRIGSALFAGLQE